MVVDKEKTKEIGDYLFSVDMELFKGVVMSVCLFVCYCIFCYTNVLEGCIS